MMTFNFLALLTIITVLSSTLNSVNAQDPYTFEKPLSVSDFMNQDEQPEGAGFFSIPFFKDQ